MIINKDIVIYLLRFLSYHDSLNFINGVLVKLSKNTIAQARNIICRYNIENIGCTRKIDIKQIHYNYSQKIDEILQETGPIGFYKFFGILLEKKIVIEKQYYIYLKEYSVMLLRNFPTTEVVGFIIENDYFRKITYFAIFTNHVNFYANLLYNDSQIAPYIVRYASYGYLLKNPEYLDNTYLPKAAVRAKRYDILRLLIDKGVACDIEEDYPETFADYLISKHTGEYKDYYIYNGKVMHHYFQKHILTLYHFAQLSDEVIIYLLEKDPNIFAGFIPNLLGKKSIFQYLIKTDLPYLDYVDTVIGEYKYLENSLLLDKILITERYNLLKYFGQQWNIYIVLYMKKINNDEFLEMHYERYQDSINFYNRIFQN